MAADFMEAALGWRSGQSYSQDLRDRVLKAVDGGVPVRQAAETFQVSIAYIYKALIRHRMTGDARINPNRGHAPRKLSGGQELETRKKTGASWLGRPTAAGATERWPSLWSVSERIPGDFSRSARVADRVTPCFRGVHGRSAC